MRNANRVLFREPPELRALGKHKYRWKDKVKMDLNRIGGEGVDWIHLAQVKV
jgi:hypothetical protein